MPLAAAQFGDERFARLLAVTREAAKDGYDAVNMRDLAARAGISLQTVYLFVSSKDHLIAEAHADSLGLFEATLAAHRLTDDRSYEQVVKVLRKMCARGSLDDQGVEQLMTRTARLLPAACPDC